ncbi:MAG: PhzF family phenazine biosynthesis protein [Gammaproteobacteria bacterium]|nr:PhzF family phenazine biosynthesis protein [Gammaproteobacteria bacterium]
MTLPLYVINAFTDKPFAGNPAAVCPLDAWLPEDTMQSIAAQNNLSETAFFVAESDGYRIRWFTPACEVKLCGHATLASAYILFNELQYEGDALQFESKSGPLTVSRDENRIALNFPVWELQPADDIYDVAGAIGQTPVKTCYGGDDLMAILDNESQVVNIKPDFSLVKNLRARGLIVTAPGDKVDFVSRFFAPAAGIPEDPVTGSAHCALTPYWSAELGKTKMTARQVSARGGDLVCELQGERVEIAGNAQLYAKGQISI